MCGLLVFIFLGGGGLWFAVSCKKRFRRVRSIAQNPISETKVTAYPYKSFGQAFSKACGNPKGKARGRSRRSEIPQCNLTNKAKVTAKPSKTNKSKSAMQLNNVGTTDVTLVTI